MTNPRILAFSGSSRKSSFNQKLVTVAAGHAERAGADVTLINLADYPMPLFNQDDEAEKGPPSAAVELKELFKLHNGFLISAPEYNSSITPLLKNTIDWLSRSYGDEPSLEAYGGKVAAIMSASPGGLGGMRGLVHVRSILTNLGVMVIPKQHALRAAGSAFDDSGGLANERDDKSIAGIAELLVNTCRKLHA